MFAVVPIAILMMSMMVAFVGTSVETSRATVSDLDTFRARAAAQNAANMAISQLWSNFTAVSGGNEQLWALRQHLDSEGLADSSATSDLTSQLGLEKVNEGLGGSVSSIKDHLSAMGLQKNHHGRHEIDGVEIENLSISRVDEFDSTSIIIDVDAVARVGVNGSSRERRASIQEIFTIAPPEWDGLEYALLANNVNCLLCHTSIDSAERVYNNNAALAGTFDAVRVGSLEAIHFHESPDSSVAGAMLIGGDALNLDGSSINNWGGINLKGAAPSAGGTIDKISEDIFGNAKLASLEMFDPSSPSDSANMFLDFKSYQGLTPYELPDSFPSPFPDNGGIDPVTGQPDLSKAGNRIVDDAEFVATVGGSAGVLSGGDISVIPHGTQVGSNNESTKMMRGTDSTIAGLTDGNVYLHGSKNDPLVLSGDIAIDGDVIISGYVKGDGTLRARGNVYVASDVLYADGGGKNRTFGVAADGSKNSLAVAAGGNIVVGDYFRPAWGSGAPADGGPDGSFNFTMDELALFNQSEWIKTQPTLKGKYEKTQVDVKVTFYDEKVKEYYFKTVTKWKWVKTGVRTKVTKYKTIWVSNGQPAPYTKSVKKTVENGFYWKDEKKKVANGTREVKRYRWVKTGVKLRKETPIYKWIAEDHVNPKYVANHMARYYSFGEGKKVPIFNKQGHFDPVSNHWVADARPGEWSTSKLTIADPGNSRDRLLYNGDGSAKAVVSIVGPTANWITDDQLARTIKLNMSGSQGHGKELEINATLYSANSILGTIPDRASSHTNGKLVVNGGIVAADVGILAPEGTQVNYDGRGARSLSITADSGLAIYRRLSAPRINP